MNSNITDTYRHNILLKLDTILCNISLSRKFEQSIYNYVIDKSIKNNITRSWDNTIFKDLYIQKRVARFGMLVMRHTRMKPLMI